MQSGCYRIGVQHGVAESQSFKKHLPHSALNIPKLEFNAAGERLFLNRYDHLGNLTNRLDGADNSSVYAYDALNRNTSVTYADNTTETFAYDAVGNLAAADNGTVSNAFVYDAMNRLVNSEVRIQNSEVSFETAYAYDLGGLITNIVYPGNKTLHYAYDADGRLASVTDWNNHTFTFTHDAAGRRTALTYPNGVSGTYTYDATHNLTSWQYAKGGAPLTGRTISRDAVGLKTGETVTAGLFPNPTQPRRMQNTFDAADRLTAAVVHSGTNTFNETYVYNANGALTNRVSLQSTVVSHHSAYTYDLAGRFSGYNSQFPIHNSQFSASYDALGNRTKTVQDGTTRLWITDHADPLKRPLMETDVDGTPVRYYLWGGGQLLAVVEADGTTHYTHSDELGSIVALTDSNGTVSDQFSYGPYGENWGRTGTTGIPFRWLGSHGVFAATPANSPFSILHSQLYLTRYRAYDAYTGRFLSSDPLGLGGGPNLYAYCLGNPLSYIDPLGLCGESLMWYDWASDWLWDVTGTAKDYYNNALPWGLAGSVNTIIDVGTGIGHMPAAIGHLGEGTGRFSADPSWENVPGVISDVLVIGSVLAITASALPSVSGSGAATAAPKSADTVAEGLRISPYRVTGSGETYIRYESANPAFSKITPIGGVKPGTFAAPASDGLVPISQRASAYNLPNPEILRPNATTLTPPAGTPIIGPRPVSGGTGNEVIFWRGY